MTEVLEGVIILDFSFGWAGSVATMVLSDFGAQVIKVEPPGGDPSRAWPQALLWNRGKKSVILNLRTPEDKEKAQALCRHADVVVESFRPGEAEALGVDYETLSHQRSDLVYCSITAFGPQGPYARYKPYEGVVAAKSGRYTAFIGQSRREGPSFGAVQVASHGAAMAAVRGILAALVVRDRTGDGQRVETSLLQGITPYDVYNWLIWQMMLKFPDRFPEDPQSDPLRRPGVGYQPIRTKDGQWIQLANLVARLFRASLESMGLADVLNDPRFQTAPTLMPEEREELRELILAKGIEKTLDEWMDIFARQTSDVAAEPLLTSQQGMGHAQMVHNRHVVELEDPRIGRMKQLGVLARMSETPGSVKGPSPEPGEHTDEVLARLVGQPVRRQAKPATRLPAHPLEGIVVLDLSSVIAGPLATSLVHELGARVIRIETLEGDLLRRNFNGLGANRLQAGAENISLNLRTKEGQEIFQKLAGKADVVVHNMRPGAPERLGVGYQQVRQINPRIIYVYASGYGDSGPHSDRPAMHPIGGAVAGGALAQLGRGGLPDPDVPMAMEEILEVSRRISRANEVNPDPNSSMVISAGILLGIYARERFGISQHILTTMLGANAYANADDFFSYEGKPERGIPDADGYGLNALYRLYRARKGWIFLACLFDEEWEALCLAIGRVDLLHDLRFKTASARKQNDDALIQELAQVFATQDAREWERTLAAAEVACVETEESGMFHFFSQDPHVAENGFIAEAENSSIGKYWRYGPVVNFSLTPSRVGSGPLRGQHSKSILRELGYSAQRIQDLYERHVVDWEPRGA